MTTTWPDVVEAASRFFVMDMQVREIRMTAATCDELIRQLNFARPAAKEATIPPTSSGMRAHLYGTPLVLDETMTDMQWKAIGRDGAVIQAGTLTREQRDVIAAPGT